MTNVTARFFGLSFFMKFMINTNTLSDDHKKQVAIFLSSYPKTEGTEIARRYINVVTSPGYSGRPLTSGKPAKPKASQREILQVSNAKNFHRKANIIIGQIRLTPGLTLSEIANKTGISKKVCEKYICALIEDRLISLENDDEFFVVKGGKDD